MPSIRSEDLTPFGRIALKLDKEFAELADVSERISRANLETDNGLDEAVKILTKAAQYGQSLAETMHAFSAALQGARDKAEADMKVVAERGQLIQQRRQRQDELEGKLNRLKAEVRTAGSSLAAPAAPAKGDLSEDDKRRIAAQLESLQAPLAGFIEAARAIKAEAAGANFRRLERQCDAMIDSLQASRQKIAKAISPK